MKRSVEHESGEKILEQMRRIHLDTVRRQEELWSAVEALRLELRGAGGGTKRRSTPAGSRRLEPGAYRRLKRDLEWLTSIHLPPGSRVAVVSRGDDDLLTLPGFEAEHYPRQPDGTYTGFYPPDGVSAIAQLEWARAEGAEYLVFPRTATWWLDDYTALTSWLDRRYDRVVDEPDIAVIFRLEARDGGVRDEAEALEELMTAWEFEVGRAPSLLDWNTGAELEQRLPGHTVFTPPGKDDRLPYLDRSVDVVALADESARALSEARRVARLTVVRLGSGSRDPELAAGAVKMEHTKNPPRPLPSVSVVLPTWNGARHVVPCFRALDETLPAGFQGEVLVVDDASDEETRDVLVASARRYPWLRLIRNDENLGFLRSCNRGAREATGDYLIFLNDDTVPLPGWLEALIGTFRQRPDAGAVGAKLIYPDGRLQEAGGAVFNDAGAANIGRGEADSDAPLFNFLRRVDYCSGAVLATPRTLFLELGGFDERFRPIYYEETDYCFSVRASGRHVYYQPKAAVVHVEGATMGTDDSQGGKPHQARNRLTFMEKWRAVLPLHPAPPGRYDQDTWHLLTLHRNHP